MLDTLLVSDSQRAHLNEATERYAASVTQRAASYLMSRGITRDVAERFKLGEVVDPLAGDEKFTGMLSVPYLTPGGTVAIKYRCVAVDHDCKQAGHHKYDGPPGQKARLYNVLALQSRSDVIALCEGEFSALVCDAIVGVPAVGTPGTQWAKEKPHWPRVFADYDRILVIADHDVSDKGEGPGVVHAKRVASTLHGAQVVYPPAGLDLDEWVQRDGVDVVRKAMGL